MLDYHSNLQEKYLPWAFAAWDLLVGGTIPYAALLGIGTGHLYFFLERIYPQSGGARWINTPNFFRQLFPSRNFGRGNPGFGHVIPPRQNQPQASSGVFGSSAFRGRGYRLDS